MAYAGVKFKIIRLSDSPPKDARIKKLKYWCEKFHDYNLAPPYEGGSYGNLSFRVKKGSDEFIITGSRIGLKKCLSNRNFVRVSGVDFDKNIVYSHGLKEPSSESMLHFAIYHKRKDVNAIFHGHCEEILCSAARLKFCQTAKKEPYGTLKLIKSVLKALGNREFVIMKGHGFISMGKTLKDAGVTAIKAFAASIKK
ncbi:MAG: class II aldolase/adducin family protein [Candidatus Omnitrophota bacterium]|jgi:ribulose-5-phosphate 4-epimerase/fuculose-1-phosphate aldolase